MDVGNLGSSSGYAATSAAERAKKAKAAIDDFMKIATQTPAQRMQDMWMKAHGLDKETLAAMTPEQRETVLKQMSEEIKKQLQQEAANKTKGGTVDILV